jgi:hypothetical protein
MPTKPLIFLSHIAEEAQLAQAFRESIEKNFLGMVDIFVSSDGSTIGLGTNWLDQITEGLRSTQAILTFCSPASISRPWINFEAGAGWARNIEIAPLCHSGIRPVDLPLPLNLLQGVEAHNPEKLGEVYKLIARKVGCVPPTVDLAPLANTVVEFETVYVVKLKASSSLRAIGKLWPELIVELKKASAIASEGVEEWKVDLVREHLMALQEQKLLEFAYNRTRIMLSDSGSGDFGALKIRTTNDLREALRQM